MHALMNQVLSNVWAGHALYCPVTGIWRILDNGAFQKVSGRKPDRWLVKTVGSVVTVMRSAGIESITRLSGRGT